MHGETVKHTNIFVYIFAISWSPHVSALLHQPQVNYHFLQLLYMHYILVIVTITALQFVSVQTLKQHGH